MNINIFKQEGGRRLIDDDRLLEENENDPLVSIITPSFNSEKFIEKTIQSILNQDYKNIEYIIIDGGSTDKTIEIIKKYDRQIDYWVSEEDSGMYEAIMKGFAVSHGSIMAWLNSDDMYMSWAVSIMVDVFRDRKIEWCTAIPSVFDSQSRMVGLSFITPIYSRRLIRKGYYHGKGLGFIQQESTFWRRCLWDKIKGNLRTDVKYAGDFYLWKEFANHADLYTAQTMISGFRKHDAQLTTNQDLYYDEIKNFVTPTTVILGKLKFNVLLSILKNKKAIKTNKIY